MENKIKDIISDFYIKNGYLVNRKDSSFKLLIESDTSEKGSSEKRSSQLSSYLYKIYYSEAGTLESSADDHAGNQADSKNYFLKHLIQSLDPETTFYDSGWTVYEKGVEGSVYVEKGFTKSIFSSGHFLTESLIQPMSIGSAVKKAQAKVSAQSKEYFVYFHGNTPEAYTNNFLVRYYFNCNRNHASNLLKKIIDMLNTYNIPFNMKCPKSASNFTRKDSIVLYLNKRFANYAYKVIKNHYPELKKLLLDDAPAFMHPILPGIGFAESPPNNAVSFGMSRCDIISKAIIKCVSEDQDIDTWSDHVFDSIVHQGFRIETFYLNPYSQYPYEFN